MVPGQGIKGRERRHLLFCSVPMLGKKEGRGGNTMGKRNGVNKNFFGGRHLAWLRGMEGRHKILYEGNERKEGRGGGDLAREQELKRIPQMIQGVP